MLGTDICPAPEATPTGVPGQMLAAIVTDDRGLVCAVSPQLAELGLDVSPERIGRHWTELLPSFRRLPVAPGSGDDDFVVIIEADRSAFRFTRLPLAGGSGDAAGALLLVRPVDLDADAESVAARHLGMLTHVSERVGHEINNALTPITGWTEMLLADASPSDAIYDPLSTIDEELTRLKEIATTLVEFGRETEAAGEPFLVNDLVRTVVAFLRLQVKHQNVILETDLSPEVGAVQGSRGRLKQVFLNLLLNALAAMPEGGELRVESRPSQDGAGAEIRFADTGHGIPPEAVPRIFDVHFTTRADQGGTGIGLALSRDFVRGMGGEVALEATSGAGTTFVVRMPLAAMA